MKLLLLLAAMQSIISTERVYRRNSKNDWSWVYEKDSSGSPGNQDIFFDRVVFLTTQEAEDQPITTGVFFTQTRILTSFNPFRKHYRNALNVNIRVLTSRTLTKSDTYHKIKSIPVSCARQAVPVTESSLGRPEWHGTSKVHSPLHDLLVLRIDDNITFLNPDPSLYSFKHYSLNKVRAAGPMTTELATLEEQLGKTVKFASLGFRDEEHMKESRHLRSRQYEWDDNVVEECEEWIPRAWGLFFCIRNVDRYPGIGSGAVLVYNNKVFGIGSFLLRKGKVELLIFTDIRPYHDVIFSTCRT